MFRDLGVETDTTRTLVDMAGVLRLERGEINCPLKNVLIVDDHIDRYEWVLKDNSELGLRVTVEHTVFSGTPIRSHLK